MTWVKDNSIDVRRAKADGMTPEELRGKLIIGEFKNVVEPEYTDEYQKILDRIPNRVG